MSKGYVVALLKLTNKEHFVNDYATKVPAIIEEFGGRIVARTPNAHFREGKEFSLHVVVEFDDFEKGKEIIEEFKEYTSHNTDRLNVKEIKEILLNLDFIKNSLIF